MIELPEAVAIARQLSKALKGRRVVSANAGNSPHKWVWYRPSREALGANSPHRPSSARKRKGARGLPRVYYAAQVAAGTPTIVLFVNAPDLFQDSYLRYLQEKFRAGLEMPEVPIRLILRERTRRSDRRRAGGATGPAKGKAKGKGK